jgi:hypothetical protein
MNTEITQEFEFPAESEGFKELVREFSPCGRVVMVVGIRPDGAFTYSLYFWDMSEYEYIDSGYWSPCSSGGMFSDIDAATNEARKTLVSKSVNEKI